MRDSDESSFLSSLNLPADSSSSGLVSFALKGTLSVGDNANVSGFAFGICDQSTVTLTSYYTAAANDKLGDAVEKAIAGLTIPHTIDDLNSLPAGAICRLDATGSLKFTACVTYSFLNDPLAAASIGSLPKFCIQATASATLEGSATHTSGHTVTAGKLPTGLLHLAVCLTKTDDFETSLTVSSGVAANIGDQDALAFLLDKIDPSSTAEADAIANQMKDAAQFKSAIKSAIDKALAASLGASLKASLEKSATQNRAFVYEIDLNGLDGASQAALEAALTGDFTAMTKPGAQLKGIKTLDSALTVTATDTHTIALHLLGIFNAASVNQFVAKSKIDLTADTHEIVLCDESLQVVDNNLDAEKLRKLVLKDITLTLPASANTKDTKTPITLAFLDREASAGASKMRQFVNALESVDAPTAGAAQALLNRNLKHYGVCSLFLGLSLDPGQCRRLFIGANGANDFAFFIRAICSAEKAILAGDPESAYRLKVFNADQHAWEGLQTAGSASNITPKLRDLGMSDAESQLAVTDALTAVWWAEAMANYATALAKGHSLEAVGKKVVKDSNRGYNEPWMILAAFNLAGKPPIQSQFTSSLSGPAAAVGSA